VLQIFGVSESAYNPSKPWTSTLEAANPFLDTRILGMTGLCTLTHASPNSPLSITISEQNITTTCRLTTYECTYTEDIPFLRDELKLKIIMRASWLADALAELASTEPETLTLTASPAAPFFALESNGPLGSAMVAFQSKDKALLETFMVGRSQSGTRKMVQSYKFAHVKAVQRALGVASKVSIRGDEQGVLSLQFMIEVEPGKVSFVDYRFVPLAEEDGDSDGEERDEDNESEGDDESGNGPF
jgi:cell cycle checkpoint protein